MAKLNGWPLEVSAALIGSCTNSSYEDITRAASIARQANAHGLKAKTKLLSLRFEQVRGERRKAAGAVIESAAVLGMKP